MQQMMALMSTITESVTPAPVEKTAPTKLPRDGKYRKLHKWPHYKKMVMQKPDNYFLRPTKGEENNNNTTWYKGEYDATGSPSNYVEIEKWITSNEPVNFSSPLSLHI